MYSAALSIIADFFCVIWLVSECRNQVTAHLKDYFLGFCCRVCRSSGQPPAVNVQRVRDSVRGLLSHVAHRAGLSVREDF